MRFCFYAGPGAGKTTMAAELFGAMKRRQYSVDLVPEYVKSWTYLNRRPTAFDQPYIFGKQQQYEYKILGAGVKNIVSDSPVYLSHIYAHVYGGQYGMSKALLELADIYDKAYPSVSIYLDRGDKPYNPEGRWGTLQEAKMVDKMVLDFLREHHENSMENFMLSDWNSLPEILDFVDFHASR